MKTHDHNYFLDSSHLDSSDKEFKDKKFDHGFQYDRIISIIKCWLKTVFNRNSNVEAAGIRLTFIHKLNGSTRGKIPSSSTLVKDWMPAGIT